MLFRGKGVGSAQVHAGPTISQAHTWGLVPGGCMALPPAILDKHACENITFPQLTFADGNKYAYQ